MTRAQRSFSRRATSALAQRKRSNGRRHLRLETLEARQMMALLSTGTGEGHVQVQVNEYGAYGNSLLLDVTTVQNPNGPREIDDAFYDPLGALPRAGTTFMSGVAMSVDGSAPVFLTAGTLGGTGNFDNGTFQAIDPNARLLQSTFFYPATALPNGSGATFRIDLRQTITPRFVSGIAPIGVTLQQQYTITNLTGSASNVQLFRYVDGDLLFDGTFQNDGGGMRQVIAGSPEAVWMTNTATNTNRNDPTYMEVRSSATGIQRPNRWEVGLSALVGNGPLLTKILNGGPLADDIIPVANDLDGNNKVDNLRGNDWAIALRNSYSIAGGQSTVYVTETQWGDPELGDVDPPVVLPPQRGVVTGVVYRDRDQDGTQDPTDFGLPGVRVFADLNNNGRYTAGEPYAISNSSGQWSMTLNVGGYSIRQEQYPGFTQTEPLSGSYNVTIAAAGDLVDGLDFGNFAAPGSISGFTFEDFNNNGRLDIGEVGLPGSTIYADINNDGILSAGEPSTVSVAGGAWSLANIESSVYVIRQAPPSGYEQTFPSGNAGQVVSVFPGSNVTGIVFGARLRDGSVSGKVYFDANGNGLIDPGEPGAAGVIVYLDRDNNCNIGLGENAILTDARGTFGVMGVRPGTYTVRLALPAGLDQVLPPGGSGNCLGTHTVTVQPGQTAIPVDFLVASTGGNGTKDFGDAPFPYPTTLAQNGARATVARDFGLGEFQDTEFDGQPTPLADGDDFNLSPDDDGVVFLDPLRPGQPANLRVQVETGSRSAARLQGFIDWNRDGDWNDANERVILNRLLTTGVHIVQIQVPANAVPGRTFARFRYGYEMNLGPTGDSIIGEVEDYTTFVVGPVPDAANDTFTLDEVAPEVLDVLANDIPSASGDLTIVSVNTTGINGTVTIAADGLSLTYTPTGNEATETFTYTVEDPAGNPDTATVTVNIVLPPTAVDDTDINVPFNAIDEVLPVLDNDIARVGTLTIIGVTQPPQGSVRIENGQLLYTPATGFSGTETFTYTIRNGANQTDSANVTVVVNPTVADDNDLVGFDIQLFLPDGVTPIVGDIAPGQQFFARVMVDDLRDEDVPPADDPGVFSAFVDLLYDRTRIQVVSDDTLSDYDPILGFNIVFGISYPQLHRGDIDTLGVIDQVGAGQTTGNAPLGPNPVRLFQVRLQTLNNPGTAAITTDPAETTIDEEVLLFEPPTVVQPDQIRLDQVIINIDPSLTPIAPLALPASQPMFVPFLPMSTEANVPTAAGGTGHYRNATNPFDVNNDGSMTPLDALLIINTLNSSGPRTLLNDANPRSQINPVYLDVSGDDYVAPLDALMIITELNARGGQGEGSVASLGKQIPLAAPPLDTATLQPVASVTLQPGESVTLPLFEATARDAAEVPAAAGDESAPLSFAPASSLPEYFVLGSESGADFGSALGSADGSDDFEDLVRDLAEDSCLFWQK